MPKDKRKKAGKHGKRRDKLVAKAIVFRARRQGASSPKAIERFRKKLLEEGCAHDEIDESLQEAQARFEQGDAHLFLCNGSSCKKRKLTKPARKVIKSLGKECRLHITETRCLGPCSHAPAAVLRVGERCRFFVDLDSEKSTVALQSFIAGKERPHAYSTAPVSQMDAVETAEPLVSHLEPLRFLLGNFRGEAQHVQRGPSPQRVVGSFEAGGQALSLRIVERSENGAEGMQSRLYLIHWNGAIGELEARIYTSQGDVLDGPVRIEGEQVIAPDVLPADAPAGTVSAERRFFPTASGIDCALELSRGGGFEPWLQAELKPSPQSGKRDSRADP